MAAERRALVDVHHLGRGQTGNETWARNVAAALERQGGPPVAYAVTVAGLADLPPGVGPDRTHIVSGSSARRLVLDLPLAVRRSHAGALLVHYSLPLVRVPGVVLVHDLSFERPEAREWIPARSLWRYRTTVRSSVRRAARLLVPTEWTKTNLVEHYQVDPALVGVAPNAVDGRLAALLSAPRRPTDAPTAPVVLAVGTVLPRKNLLTLARAVDRLRRADSPARLRLVGPVLDAGRPQLAEMTTLLGDALEVVGPVSTEQLAVEYLGASVLGFPSRFEGFGIPLLEAMAAGTPVVSSSATCLPEVAGDAALLADPDDIDGWASELTSVLTDPATAQRLRVAGRARVAAYDWADTARVTQAALTAAASG